MANISVTYTFANSTTADATQVNQNFTDIINGTSDGTKDFSIAALTVAGTATLNGAVNLGNSSTDDLTITASLASSIAVKTQRSYSIGSSTVGLATVYLGGNSTYTVGINAPSSGMSASYTVTMPAATGAVDELLQADGSSNLRWAAWPRDNDLIENLGLALSVGSGALTIALKQADGSTDPDSTDPVRIAFRDGTASNGITNIRKITSSLSLTVPAGATLATESGIEADLILYAVDDAGTVTLAICGADYFDEAELQSVSAIGSGSDDNTTLYGTAKTSKPIRKIARLVSTQTTAGTWAAVPTSVILNPLAITKKGPIYLGSQTTTGSWSTNTTYAGKYWRDGEWLVGDVSITLAGAPTAANLSIDLPLSLTMNTNRMISTDTENGIDGSVKIKDSGTNNYSASLFYSDSNTLLVKAWSEAGSGYSTHGTVTATNPITFASGDILFIKYRVPISGWQ